MPTPPENKGLLRGLLRDHGGLARWELGVQTVANSLGFKHHPLEGAGIPSSRGGLGLHMYS